MEWESIPIIIDTCMPSDNIESYSTFSILSTDKHTHAHISCHLLSLLLRRREPFVFAKNNFISLLFYSILFSILSCCSFGFAVSLLFLQTCVASLSLSHSLPLPLPLLLSLSLCPSFSIKFSAFLVLHACVWERECVRVCVVTSAQSGRCQDFQWNHKLILVVGSSWGWFNQIHNCNKRCVCQVSFHDLEHFRTLIF
jgi:hypothetical protein